MVDAKYIEKRGCTREPGGECFCAEGCYNLGHAIHVGLGFFFFLSFSSWKEELNATRNTDISSLEGKRYILKINCYVLSIVYWVN